VRGRGKRGCLVDADADYKWRSRVLVVTAEMGGERTVRCPREKRGHRTFNLWARLAGSRLAGLGRLIVTADFRRKGRLGYLGASRGAA